MKKLGSWGATALAFGASLGVYAAQVSVPESARQTFVAIAANAQVRQALDFIRQDDARTLAEQKEIVVIPSPPFKEEVRAKDYLRRMVALGFRDARIDQEGNVIA